MTRNLSEPSAAESEAAPANGQADGAMPPAGPEPELIARERRLLEGLTELCADRGRVEKEIAKAYASRTEANELEYGRARQALETRRATEIAEADAAIQGARHKIPARCDAETGAAKAECDAATKKSRLKASNARDAAQNSAKSAKWEAGTVYEATSKGAARLLAERTKLLNACDARLDDLISDRETVLKRIRQYKRLKDAKPAPAALMGEEPFDDYKTAIEQAFDRLFKLNALSIPRMFTGPGPIWIFILTALPMLYPAYLLGNLKLGGALIAAFSLAAGIPIWILFWSLAKKKAAKAHEPLAQLLADCEAFKPHCRRAAQELHDRAQTACKEKRDLEIASAEERLARKTREIDETRELELRVAETARKERHDAAISVRDRDLAAAEERDRVCRADSDQRYHAEKTAIKEKYHTERQAIESWRDEKWSAMAEKWRSGLAHARSEIAYFEGESRRLFVPWPGVSWNQWKPPSETPSVMRLGEFFVDTSLIPDVVPKDEGLKNDVIESFRLPALFAFPERSSVVVKAEDQGKAHAGKLLQALMLRLMTSVPPGKVRFTILDPVTLGENFASFMHLTDIDEGLVTQRIWTEPDQIDERLADLQEHMETVIQKYLRNEFRTLEEYNIMAGEVAEPYRYLVVANFPSHFSDTAIKRLHSIASNGPRCGVFVLVSVDAKLSLPHGFRMRTLEDLCVTLSWRGGSFHWNERGFERSPITADSPPPPEEFIDAVQIAGVKAKEAKRVEVPFEVIAPPAGEWWVGDCKSELVVPLGRAGANKLQAIKLGRGTSQHALIAGKTGSGKSTLLHALITNSALRYSPHEVELYLIDFKKGVEFKTYAVHELPHARVIAVESEREFGLSVLQRLDVELKGRGDRFRDAGAQDLKAYRLARPNEPVPRILLIVDEFQEFFIEDDKIAQDCSLLLDRLVRQGRAFGMHVLLGSQTLGGSYSLPRSTVGQMAVRIALQCSETDAHLILSEENSAARLLSRPGEAIYNDANGLVEGNHPFQVVWLPDERREIYLKDLHGLAAKRNMLPSTPAIVFEGNEPADVAKNPFLNELLSQDDWPRGIKAFTAWLGDAIAIKDPTAIVFRRLSGANALIVGQAEDAARGIMAMMFIELATQHPAEAASPGAAPPAQFVILDGTLADSPHADDWKDLAPVVPHDTRFGGPRETAALLTEVYTELDRRQKANDLEAPTIYLFIFDLQRFRDLRKQEDEFGYSRRGADGPPSPSKQMSTILREGPSLGIHVIIWCDTLNNLNRTFDRQSLREFDSRILFQMSSSDSSSLIDSPTASRLGPNRAFFHSEEQARLEKFRPYALPAPAWLKLVGERLSRRAQKTKKPAPDGTAVAAANAATQSIETH